jgi:Phytanoyl-CoA dioxygenase (PhyH)
MLSQAEVSAFLAEGYVAIRRAVPASLVQACQEVIWAGLGQRGIRRDDPETWTEPVVRINCPEGGPFAAAGTRLAVQEACDQLIGTGRWWRREGIGGTIPVRFPGEDDPGDAGWHIEASYEDGGQWRVNVGSRGRGLLALYLFTDVDEASAPTRLRPGSHRDVPPLLAPAGAAGLDWPAAAQQAAQATAHRPAALATGEAGDVFLCHPFLVHAASWPHRGHQPRIIAQPGVALHEEYPLHERPGEQPPPVQHAILDSLAAARTGNGGEP